MTRSNILINISSKYAPVVQRIEHQPSKLVTRVRLPPGVRIINLIFMNENKNEVEEELTDEEIAKLDELFGFGCGCDCSHCGHDCHGEDEEEVEDKE